MKVSAWAESLFGGAKNEFRVQYDKKVAFLTKNST